MQHEGQAGQGGRDPHGVLAATQRGGGGPPDGLRVVDSGAGGMPAVIRPVTNPGRTRTTRTPVPCSRSANPRAKASRPALAEPYTGLARRGRTAATEDSTTMVPRPRARIFSPTASSVLTCTVKFAS